MEFNSLKEILKHFELEEDDAEIIRKKLKKLRNKLHPDKTEGNFENDEDKQEFLNLQGAIKFLEKKTSKQLTVKGTNTAVSEILKDFTKSKKLQQDIVKVEKQSSKLSSILDDNVKTFHRKTKSPKITTIAITTVISALWLFPNVVKNHPVLSVLLKYNAEFSFLWLSVMIISCFLWLKIKSIESNEEDIMRSYKMENTQNKMFTLFIKWIQCDYQKIEYKKDHSGKYIYFTSDDLTEFLINRYELFKIYLKRNSKDSDRYEFTKRLREDEENGFFEQLQNRRRNLFSPLTQFLPKPGEINLEIAQMLSDLIIQRLLSKEIIKVSDKKNLSETYQLEE